MSADPVHIPNATPFDLIEESANDLLTEARNWADGQSVETQGQADEVSRLIDELRKIARAADDARKDEVKPYDEAKAAVQAKYAPLFADPKTKKPGRVFAAIDALKATLTPFLRKLDEEKREAERKAREEAEAKMREAQEAVRAAAASDLAAKEEAEAKIAEAEAAEAAARAAAKDKAHATGGERAIGLRTRHVGTITDLNAAVKHYWSTHRGEFEDLVQRLVDADVRAGRRGDMIPGVAIVEERVL